MKDACTPYDEKYYTKLKNCDEYFYLPHRKEARGEGGIFFDYLNSGDWEKDFSFVKDVGTRTLEAITEIVKFHKDTQWNEIEKEAQLIKRGRYVEFNLIWDRGTLFGLKTGGATEADNDVHATNRQMGLEMTNLKLIKEIISNIPDPEIPKITIKELGVLRKIEQLQEKNCSNYYSDLFGLSRNGSFSKDIKEKLEQLKVSNFEIQLQHDLHGQLTG